MNGLDLLEAVGGVDASFIAEAAEENAADTRRAEKRRRLRTAGLAAGIAAAAAAVVLLKLSPFAPRPEVTLPPKEEGSMAFASDGTGPVTVPSVAAGEADGTASGREEPSGAAQPPERESTTKEASMGAVPEPSGSVATTDRGNTSGEGHSTAAVTTPTAATDEMTPEASEAGPYSGGVTTPSVWSEAAPVIRGTGYTREEIDGLLWREEYAIAQMVALETGCSPEDVTVCRGGYCHARLGEENVVNLDYLTLPVCAGGKVVGSVELFRVAGQIHYSVLAGGPRWDNLNRALRYGAVAFIYAGYGELAVAADGTVFEITVDAAQAVAGQTDLYARAACAESVFSQAELESALTDAEAAP